MRILYLNSCGQMGGAETSLVDLLRAVQLAEPGWDLHLVLGAGGPLAEKAESIGVKVKVLAFPAGVVRCGDSGLSGVLNPLAGLMQAGLASRDYVTALREVIHRTKPDVIHAAGFKMHVLAAQALDSSIPMIWHVHDYVSWRPLMKQLFHWYSSKCALVIANSASVAEDARAAGCRGLRVVCVHNAVDLEKFSPAGPALDLDSLSGMAAATPGTLRVGLVATFAKWKGHTAFFDALALVPADLPFRGYVIGGPIYQTNGSQYSLEELRLELLRRGLTDRVGFTGLVENAASAMRALDIVVHASTKPEPFGMVIVEGMACGKPVVASLAGGVPEIFEDGVHALGHRMGDAAALAGCIARLARDPELRRRLGYSGRQVAEARFNHQRLARDLAWSYRQLVGLPADAGRALAAHA